MKLFISFAFIFFIFCGTVFSQNEIIEYDEANLYHRAALAVFQKRLEDYGDINEREFRKITVFRENKIIKLPKILGQFEIEYLDLDDLKTKYLSHKKSRKKNERAEIPIMQIHPMVNKGSKIEIRFTDQWFSTKGKVYNFALEGGSIITFGFDCQTEKFILEDVELWGI